MLLLAGLAVFICLLASRRVRLAGLLILVPLLLFCGFGFLASYEPVPGAMYFRLAYAVAGFLSAGAIFKLVVPNCCWRDSTEKS